MEINIKLSGNASRIAEELITLGNAIGGIRLDTNPANKADLTYTDEGWKASDSLPEFVAGNIEPEKTEVAATPVVETPKKKRGRPKKEEANGLSHEDVEQVEEENKGLVEVEEEDSEELITETKSSKPTVDTVIKALRRHSEKNSHDAAIAILYKYGVKGVRELNEKHYPSILQELG